MKKIFRFSLWILFLAFLTSCEEELPGPDPNDVVRSETGTLDVLFRVSHPWIPARRIARASLHVAKDGMEIYKGNYLQSANVTNYVEHYFFYLEPGTYYYEASIGCLCGGDTCSAGGFPGNQFGTKHTMGKFSIKADEVTVVIPTFQ